MEAGSCRQPLAIRNSSIPRPVSRLPQPTTMLRKRSASEQVSDGKENALKRVKLDENLVEASAVPATNPPSKPAAACAVPKSAPAARKTAKPPGITKKTSQGKGVVGKAAAATSKVAGVGRVTSSASAAAGARGKTNPPGTVAGKSGSSSGGGGGGGGKQKRPAWDLKGRLQDVEGLMADERKNAKLTIEVLQSQLGSLSERLGGLEQVKEQQEGTIRVQQQEQSTASSQIKDLENELSTTRQKLLERTRGYENEVEMLKLSKSALQRSHDDLESNLKGARSEVVSLKATVSQMAADASAIQCQLGATKVARDQAIADALAKAELITRLQGDVEQHLATIVECRERIQEDETMRRRLHNTIQELKGNIRVFCRIRPILPGEGGLGSLDDSTTSNDSASSGASSHRGRKNSKGESSPANLQIEYPDRERDRKKIAMQFSGAESTPSRSYDFEFDQVFSPESRQLAVFDEISQLVQSALDGYNVCIFAYGQTGSGKTYTMEGPAGGEEGERGMIPRAVQQVFQTASNLREKGWEYHMEASFVEIYNETLRDLLAAGSNSGDVVKHEIKMDPNRPGEVYITGLSPVHVNSEQQVARLLEHAARNRAVAATHCNERSSRSHSVFRLKLSGSNGKTGETCEGTLNLIDLAGSERLSQSGSVGDRLRETKNINKSLSNLGIVIMALANKEQHIPYRNSKLTYLLQNSLGGNSKTLMFVNVSPQPTSFQETLCSLRFATKVNQCNIGTAKKVAK